MKRFRASLSNGGEEDIPFRYMPFKVHGVTTIKLVTMLTVAIVPSQGFQHASSKDYAWRFLGLDRHTHRRHKGPCIQGSICTCAARSGLKVLQSFSPPNNYSVHT
jgi:hypothetical protein